MVDRAGLVAEPQQGGEHPLDLPTIPGVWLAAIVAGSIILVFGLMVLNGIVVRHDNVAFALLAGPMLLLGACRYRARNADRVATKRIRDFSEYCLLFMAFSLLGVVSTYPIAAISLGFIDGSLSRMDGLFFFDWNGWYAFVAARPSLQILGVIAYSTIYLSPLILLGYMAWHGQRAVARRFLVTFWLAATITLLLFPLFPAKGPLAVFWTGPIPYMPVSALYQAEIIPLLRADLFREIDLGALRGLVCAPSFHTVCGVLYIVAAWPIRRLRWPLTIMNAAMLLATPVEGNHYLTDMLLGLVVALFAIVLVKQGEKILVARRPRPALLGAHAA